MNNTYNGNKNITASIFKISKQGLVTINFRTSIRVPENIENIDQKVLDINIMAGEESDPSELKIISWNIISKNQLNNLINIQNFNLYLWR